MQLIKQAIESGAAGLPEVELVADRFKLQKRRWRGEASDGADFGFELAEPLGHGAVFFESATHRYHIRQTPESVLAIRLAHGVRLGEKPEYNRSVTMWKTPKGDDIQYFLSDSTALQLHRLVGADWQRALVRRDRSGGVPS